MKPFQIMGIIACGTSIFAGVVTFLTMQGVPLLLAFLSVYVIAVWVMLGMQRRALQAEDGIESSRQCRYAQDYTIQQRLFLDDTDGADLHASRQLGA